MGINNLEAGRRFAKTARVILTQNMDEASSIFWFSDEQMLDVAGQFSISAVFQADLNHWRLVLGIPSIGVLIEENSPQLSCDWELH